MNTQLQHQLTELLQRAGQAHGHYENTVLKGVYDQDWAPWYADWVVQHGFNQLLNTNHDAASLGQLLFDLNEDHKRDTSAQSWASYTAVRLVQMQQTKSGPM